MKYEIGQEVWLARFESTEFSVECPDCAGKCYLTCIMGDGTEVTIDCQACKVGYDEFSRGRIKTYNRTPTAVKTIITGMDVQSATEVKYRVPESYIVPEDKLFLTEEDALIKAKEISDGANRREIDQISKKEKDTRSWAWNASYHRKALREADREIKYHTQKLNVAREKAKKNAA